MRLARRTLTLGRGLRDSLRSRLTHWHTVEIEDDRMAGRYQIQLPDEWGKDVAFFLLPPEMQEAIATEVRLDKVQLLEATPAYLMCVWPDHFSAKDLPRLERRLTDVTWVSERWEDGVPASLHPYGTAGVTASAPPPPPVPPPPPAVAPAAPAAPLATPPPAPAAPPPTPPARLPTPPLGPPPPLG